jgi:hypothetical protein
LTDALNNKSDELNQKNTKIIQDLQQELQEHQGHLKEVMHMVSEIFKIQEPVASSNTKEWLAELTRRHESYQAEIHRAAKIDIKESKDPIRRLAEQQKKKMKSREFALSNYLNSQPS